MSLLIVAYPEIEKKDFDWIQSFRRLHDERYYKLIEPHFTMVFPLFNIDEKTLIDHAGKITQRFRIFYFVLRCAQIVKDSFSDYTDLFLVPEEGYRIFVKLHDALYTGPLEKDLRLDIPFIPHLGIAGYKDPFYCKKLADEINSNNLEIIGTVSQLDLIRYEENKINMIHRIFLKEN